MLLYSGQRRSPLGFPGWLDRVWHTVLSATHPGSGTHSHTGPSRVWCDQASSATVVLGVQPLGHFLGPPTTPLHRSSEFVFSSWISLRVNAIGFMALRTKQNRTKQKIKHHFCVE